LSDSPDIRGLTGSRQEKGVVTSDIHAEDQDAANAAFQVDLRLVKGVDES
jgi:hypothetical protein